MEWHYVRTVSFKSGQNKVSIEWVAHELALRTTWEFNMAQSRSVLNEKLMECYYAQTESSKWSYKVRIELVTHGLVLRTA